MPRLALRSALGPVVFALAALASPAAGQTAKPAAAPAQAAAAPAADARFEGHWLGTFKAGQQDAALTLHIAPADSGGFALTYDFPLQGQVGAPSPATFTGTRVAIRPAPGVVYEGTLSAAGDAITGKLTQGSNETPITFVRTAAPPPPAAEVADPDGRTGDYAGALSMGAMSLEMTMHLRRTAEGYVATLDVPAQNGFGLRATSATVEGDRLTVVFPFPGDPTFVGTFAGDGLDGTWRQGGREMPLVLARVAAD